MESLDYHKVIKEINFNKVKEDIKIFQENLKKKARFRYIEDMLGRVCIVIMFFIVCAAYPLSFYIVQYYNIEQILTMLYVGLVVSMTISCGFIARHSDRFYNNYLVSKFLFKKYQIFLYDKDYFKNEPKLQIYSPECINWLKNNEEAQKLKNLITHPEFPEALKAFHLDFVNNLYDETFLISLYYTVSMFLDEKKYESAILAFINYQLRVEASLKNYYCSYQNFYENLDKNYQILSLKNKLEEKLTEVTYIPKRNKI